MFVFFICVFALIATCGHAINENLFGVPVFYYVLGTLLISYLYILITKGKELSIDAAGKCLILFEVWGLLYVGLSPVGMNKSFNLDLYFDPSYIPRHAVYFFVLPAMLLFREDIYVKGKDWFLNHYGEAFFWILLAGHMIYCQQLLLTVHAQALLCWLSFRVETKSAWRRWARITALVLLPMSDGGESTMLILRALFLLVCIVRKPQWRVMVKIIAFGLAIIIIACLTLPLVMDSTIIPDYNTAWRLRIWKEELSILAKTFFCGVGYGTSYVTDTYISESFERMEWQFAANSEHAQRERAFVTGPHNSFVSVAMRTGIVGIILFILFLVLLFFSLIKYPVLPSKAACFGLFAAVIIILFNVGLENPGYLCTFVFLVGSCMQEAKRLKKVSSMASVYDEKQCVGTMRECALID